MAATWSAYQKGGTDMPSVGAANLSKRPGARHDPKPRERSRGVAARSVTARGTGPRRLDGREHRGGPEHISITLQRVVDRLPHLRAALETLSTSPNPSYVESGLLAREKAEVASPMPW